MRWIQALVVGILLSGFVAATAEDGMQSLIESRRARDLEIRGEEIGPFTAIGQASLRSGQALRVAHRPDTLLLGHPTADVGIPTLELTWRRECGDVFARIPMGGRFKVGRDWIGPVPRSLLPSDTIRVGRFLLQVYRGAGSARVMAFDSEHKLRKEFAGLRYFDPAPDWRVMARIEPIAVPDTVVMATSLGLSKQYLRHSRLHFVTAEGVEQQLTLFVPVGGAEYGFIPFTDATCGVDSYEAGRYLDLPPPVEGQREMMIDFNEAYNPYCAYTPHYNCPIPPEENRLSVSVTAGEMKYK